MGHGKIEDAMKIAARALESIHLHLTRHYHTAHIHAAYSSLTLLWTLPDSPPPHALDHL